MVDVAKTAGVSATTVSLALRGHSRITEATRNKVLSVCRKMGYRPDPIASALAAQGGRGGERGYLGTIALLESEAHVQRTKGIPQQKIWDDQLKQACLNMGYRMDRFVVSSSEKEQRALNRILLARGISGLIIYGFNQKISQWALDWSRFSAVAYAGSVHEHFIHNVMSTSYQDVYDAVIRLHDRGYHRPGYFMLSSRFDYWEAGFAKAFEAWGGPLKSAKLILDEGLDDSEGRDAFFHWIQYYKPDVLVANYGERLPEVLAERGFRVPEDIGYLCLDLWDSSRHLSGLFQARDAADQVTVDLLHGMLVRGELGFPKKSFCIQIPSEWNEGRTLRA